MTHEQLKSTRMLLKLNQSEMALIMSTPLRTYQDWEKGINRIPGIVDAFLSLYSRHDTWLMEHVNSVISQRITADFPQGIPSEGSE